MQCFRRILRSVQNIAESVDLRDDIHDILADLVECFQIISGNIDRQAARKKRGHIAHSAGRHSDLTVQIICRVLDPFAELFHLPGPRSRFRCNVTDIGAVNAAVRLHGTDQAGRTGRVHDADARYPIDIHDRLKHIIDFFVRFRAFIPFRRYDRDLDIFAADVRNDHDTHCNKPYDADRKKRDRAGDGHQLMPETPSERFSVDILHPAHNLTVLRLKAPENGAGGRRNDCHRDHEGSEQTE